MAKNAVIGSLGEKVGLLIEENERLTKENAALTGRRDRLTDENRDLKLAVAELQKRVKVLELERGLAGGGGDNKKAQARINQLMREIDRCIALVNR